MPTPAATAPYGGLQASDAVAETGYKSVTRLLEDHVRIDRTEALRLTRHADSLATTTSPTGTTVPPDLPATVAVVDDGTAGPGHVEVIRKTMRRLHAVVPALADEVLATTEAQLAQLATTHAPAALSQATVAILALLDPDGTAPDDDPPPENELHYLRRKDGSLAGRFTYRDPAAAEFLATALANATPPPEGAALEDQHARGLTDTNGERGESPDSQALRTLPGRRAQALLDLTGEAYQRGIDTTWPTTPTPSAAATGPEPAAEPAVDGAESANRAVPDRDHEETTAWGLFDPDPEPEPDTPDATRDEPPKPFTTPPSWSRSESEGGERVALTLTVDYETLRRQLGQATPPPPDGTLEARAARREHLHPPRDRAPPRLRRRPHPRRHGHRRASRSTSAAKSGSCPRTSAARSTCATATAPTPAAGKPPPQDATPTTSEHWVHGGETCPENCVLLCSLSPHAGPPQRLGDPDDRRPALVPTTPLARPRPTPPAQPALADRQHLSGLARGRRAD